MRIGFFLRVPQLLQGGLDWFLRVTIEEMLRRGHECVLFVPAAPLELSVESPDLAADSAQPEIAPGAETRIFQFASPDVFFPQTRELLVQSRLDVLCAMYASSFVINLPALLNGTGIPLLLSEHISPGMMENQYWTAYERRACLAGADGIHLILENYKAELPAFLHDRTTVIPLPAEKACPVDWKARNAAPRKTLLAAGRFQDEAKCFSRLLLAFALLTEKFPDWDLCLCGDGEHRKNYEDMAEALGIGSRLRMPGWVDDMPAYYAAAHIFCVPSRHEAFGLATVEAQRFALPAVGFAACTGTNAIIQSGVNGLLAEHESSESLAASLGLLMGNAVLREKMGRKGQQMLDRYAFDTVFDAWEGLLARTAAHKGNTRLAFPAMTEEECTVNALREILTRENPTTAPACAKLERRLQRRP